MKFFTQWEPALTIMEEHLESVTETAGYIPTEKLIQQFEEAGIRLEIARDFDYPNADDVPDDYDPVTFGSRLDALALDNAVKERLMAFVEQKKAETEIKSEVKVDSEVK